MNYSIEKITGDNRRPGMPGEGYLVRYSLHESFGWLRCKTFAVSPEFSEADAFAAAKTFAEGLDPSGNIKQEAA